MVWPQGYNVDQLLGCIVDLLEGCTVDLLEGCTADRLADYILDSFVGCRNHSQFHLCQFDTVLPLNTYRINLQLGQAIR